MTKIAVLGAGSWGSVLASMLADNGHAVDLYGNRQEVADEINQKDSNSRYMKDWSMNPKVHATLDLAEALAGSDIILFVLPTSAIRSVAKQVKAILDQSGSQPYLVSATKGIEPGSKKLVTQIFRDELYPDNSDRMIVLSGPSHAENVAQKDLTAITLASTSLDNAAKMQRIFSNEYVRFYTSNDPVGVQVGGAVKNVIAIAAGMLAGMGYGDNAKAALMTRGLAEITRLGVAFGGQPWTFSGLSGIGDLIVTCTSVNSRNWRAGYQLGQGQKLADVLANMGQVVEGATTVKAVHEICDKYSLDMPISEAIYHVLYEGADIKSEIKLMMNRQMGPEIRI